MRRTLRAPLSALLLGLLSASAQATGDGPREPHTIRHWIGAQRSCYFNAPLMRKAEAAIRADDAATAERLLRAALVNDPGDPRVQALLADACARLGKVVEAARLYESVVRHAPADLEAQLKFGEAAGRIGQTERAVAAYEALLREAPASYPGRRPAIRQLARWHFDLHRYEQAARYGLAWSGFQPDAEPLLLLAGCALQRQDWTGAVVVCDRLLNLLTPGTNRGGVLLQKSFALGQLGRPAEANAALLEADALPADRAQRLSILRQLGFNALKDQHADDASRYFKSYLLQAFDPAIAQAHLDALAQAGQWERAELEAREWLARSDLPPAGREPALRTLQSARQHLGRDAATPVAARPSAVLAPESVTNLARQGVAAYRAGQFAQAADCFTRALQLKPDLFGLLYLRGQAWFKLRNFRQAEDDFLRFQRQADAAGGLPRNFWGDLGVPESDLRDFDLVPGAPR